MIRDYLLRNLPPYQGKEIEVVPDQSVEDIIDEIIVAHQEYAPQYDLLTDRYIRKSVPEICQQLFEECKTDFRYRIEGYGKQTVKSPVAIAATGITPGIDCKHYASLIGGVLDALKRKGKKINWCYRFCSYDIADPTKEHVFVVVKYQDEELWIDPVLENFDQRYPIYFFHEDIKPNMALYRVSGVGQTPMYNTSIDVIETPVHNQEELYCCSIGLVDFAAVLQSAIPVITNFFKGLFGGSMYTTGVQWLTQQYQYYVLGQANATGRTDAEDRYTPEAQGWFATVLGVPIYDRYRLHALMGTNAADGASLNRTDQQKVQDYLALGPDTQNIDPAAVMQAVQIAKKFKWSAPAGGWAQFAIPAPEIKSGSGTGTGTGSGSGSGSTEEKPGIMDWIKANPFESALIGAAAVFVLRPLITKKRKRA